MKDLGEFVRVERERRSLTQEELASAVSVSPTYVSKIERAERKGIGLRVLRNLEAVFGVQKGVLEALLRDDPLPAPVPSYPEIAREIAVVPDLSAGPVGGGIVDAWEYVGLSETMGRALRAGRVKGTCMEPAISPGDVVIFDAANRTPRDGQVIVATIPDEANERGRGVVKRFFRFNGKIKLEPNVGQPIILPADDVRIEGVVIEVRKKFL